MLGLKTYTATARIKKYQSIIKKKKEKYEKIVLLLKTDLNSIEVLISKRLTDWYIIQDEFVLANNMSKEYINMKEKVKNFKI